jgi:valyl-tRNA synthetase
MNLPKVYEPNQYEPTVYGLWESSNVFASTGVGEPYAIVMPPPNANGNLHIGHALTVALEDILVRYERMRGKDAIYIPGADHAGFETWVVFEKKLAKEGKSRFDYSRDELYKQVWDFVHEQRGNMELQLRALGASCSWNDLVFTLDKKVVDTVYSTFKKLWDEGLVYRGERVVNYCTVHQTGFADIEVDHKEVKSKLWHISYPLLERVGNIEVATTRPETMLGDVAVAVNPNDVRYKDLIGLHIQLPIVKREIPIIADEAVDMDFGTGAVKVTPAHDPVDFEIGRRHNLPEIQVIDYDGKISNQIGFGYSGLDVDEARAKVLLDLKMSENLKKTEKYSHSVGHCYKCNTPIQPMIKDQWFLKITPLADRAKGVIKNGEISFTPKSKSKILLQYLDNLHDWNLSRQIPWGIPIPAFQNVEDSGDWIFDTRVDQEFIEVEGKKYKRDEDTFDAWFSSGQWPYIVTDFLQTADAPRQGASTLAKFYPTSMMETGHDLLDRWVARMIMLGLYTTDKIPFKDVYMHGMVLDENGQKMSKSKGNVINPMEMIEQYGSDALRLGVVASRSAGQNQAFSINKVVAGRNFCNKLWNIARFIENKIGDENNKDNRGEEFRYSGEFKPETLADHWVLRQLDEARKNVESYLSSFKFAEASEVVYHTIWDDVADWYIEASKLGAGQGMLAHVLATCLKLAHPFAPFVTETIWTTLKWDDKLLIRSSWPEELNYHEISASEFDQIKLLVQEARYVASEISNKKQKLVYQNDTLISDNSELIAKLANLDSITRVDKPLGLRLAVANKEVWLDIDADTLYEHQNKLETRLAECRQNISKLESRLSNENYTKQAPEKVVEETRQQLRDQKSMEGKLVAELEVL